MNINSYKNIIVLTGASVGVAQGVEMYREEDGIWKSKNIDTQVFCITISNTILTGE